MAAPEWFSVWQLGVGSGADSFELYGGPCIGKCIGRFVKDSPPAAPAFLRCTGAPRRIVWLHNRLWTSGAWRLDAATMADPLELSADAAGAAVRGFLPDFAAANDGHGFDTAGDY